MVCRVAWTKQKVVLSILYSVKKEECENVIARTRRRLGKVGLETATAGIRHAKQRTDSFSAPYGLPEKPNYEGCPAEAAA